MGLNMGMGSVLRFWNQRDLLHKTKQKNINMKGGYNIKVSGNS